MLSLPPEWDYTLQGLAYINKEGKDSVREAVKELEKASYVTRCQRSGEVKESHIGLANVRERLGLMCGGTLSVGTRPEDGTSVSIRIPDSR